jgi:hypothetical protein
MRRAAADVWGVLGQQPAACTTLLGKLYANKDKTNDGDTDRLMILTS